MVDSKFLHTNKRLHVLEVHNHTKKMSIYELIFHIWVYESFNFFFPLKKQ